MVEIQESLCILWERDTLVALKQVKRFEPVMLCVKGPESEIRVSNARYIDIVSGA